MNEEQEEVTYKTNDRSFAVAVRMIGNGMLTFTNHRVRPQPLHR